MTVLATASKGKPGERLRNETPGFSPDENLDQLGFYHMPAKRKYQPPQSVETPLLPGALPLDRAIAVYYRQSSLRQVGNISTDMQQIDLPKYVHNLGWGTHEILLIDEDEGVSGTKRIDERKGMSRLFDMIITGRIGAVAVQAEDRLFRDETQIQVNVFIEACVKHNVRVITPYFKYNFADKYEGNYHKLLFRLRAEQAADFLNSYVRGRLFAAKQRMLIQGMWMGGNINLGFIVDDRKFLSSGVPNPHWRKFEPFEPCAEIVIYLFETFLKFGGNIAATLRYVFEHGRYFPDFDDPEFQRRVPPGFLCAKPLRMIKRGGNYTPGSLGLTNMMTNAVYLGHWIHKDHIVVWNNHPAIVSEDLFFRAFNLLSPYTLEGEPNPDYAPRLGRLHSTRKKQRIPPTAIYAGLVGSFYNEKWRAATVSWENSIQDYAYTVHYTDEVDITHLLWSRRCGYFDKALTERLHEKLHATFDSAVWQEALEATAEDFEAERRGLKHQLTLVRQKMQAIIGNLSYVQIPSMIEALEADYANYELEEERLERKLQDLERRAERQDSLIALANHAERVLAEWDNMDVDSQRAVAQAFISQIIVIPTGKHRVVEVELCWRDNSREKIFVSYRSDGSTVWLPQEVEALTELLESNASQVEIAAALPDRNWNGIRIKAYEIIGRRNFHMSPKPIRDEETYDDYLVRLERDGEKANRTSGNRWRKEEIEELERLLDRQATQLEISAALPVRTWEAIRKKIIQIRGAGIEIPESGHLQNGETIYDYLERDPSAAGAFAFLISDYYSLRRYC